MNGGSSYSTTIVLGSKDPVWVSGSWHSIVDTELDPLGWRDQKMQREGLKGWGHGLSVLFCGYWGREETVPRCDLGPPDPLYSPNA